MPADDASPVGRLEGDFGPNVGLVEEIYRQWLEDPNSVAESWQDFFADYKPRLPGKSGNGETTVAEPPKAKSEEPKAKSAEPKPEAPKSETPKPEPKPEEPKPASPAP